VTKTALPPYWDHPTPLHYFGLWPLLELPIPTQNSLKSALLQIHATFLDGSGGDRPEVECWRRTFDAIASAFDNAGLVTEGRLTSLIPGMVADAGASGRWMWGRNSLQEPDENFSERLGAEYYQPWFVKQYFLAYIEGRVTYWQGRLLESASSGVVPIGDPRHNAHRFESAAIPTAMTPISTARTGQGRADALWTSAYQMRLPGNSVGRRGIRTCSAEQIYS
jgi:hypothetical protein